MVGDWECQVRLYTRGTVPSLHGMLCVTHILSGQSFCIASLEDYVHPHCSSSKHHSLALAVYWALWVPVAEYRVPFEVVSEDGHRQATKTCSLMDELPTTQVGGCVNPKLKCFFWFTWYHFNYAFIAVLSSVESTYKPISSIEGCQPSFLKSLYSWFYMTVLWIHDHIV